MKTLSTLLRLVALLLVVGSLTWWALRGAHVGWTQTSVTTMSVDEITGLEYPVRTDRLVPGLDFLGLSVGVAIVLGGVSLWTARRGRAL